MIVADYYQGKRVLVIGLGLSGCAAVRWVFSQGAVVYGVDSNAHHLEQSNEILHLRQQGCVLQHSSVPLAIEDFDLVVVSPGVPPANPHYSAACRAGIEVIGEVELACRHINQWRNVAITGTNGKTTVTLLTAHILQCCGFAAVAAGNCGVPLSTLLSEKLPSDGIIVIELSSFQLETLNTALFDAAALLNITPDHLDRYCDITEYAQAKMNLFGCLKAESCGYIHNSCAEEFSALLPSQKLYRYGARGTDLYLAQNQLIERGNAVCTLPTGYHAFASHDRDNFLAAYALCRRWGIAPEAIVEAALSFNKPPHRLQYVGERNGVIYIDDSKGTNVDAVIKAVASLQGPLILIAGGVDKGASYAPWRNAFAGKVRAIMAIGQAAEMIERELSTDFIVKQCSSLDEAVLTATTLACEGDTVLLSPGCSSYDMFRSYVHRGQEFQRLVVNLTMVNDASLR